MRRRPNRKRRGLFQTVKMKMVSNGKIVDLKMDAKKPMKAPKTPQEAAESLLAAEKQEKGLGHRNKKNGA